MTAQRHRVAILCAGLDAAQGGYESHTRMLFDHASLDITDVDLTLYKSLGPPGPHEVCLNSPNRNSRTVAILERLGRDRFFWESFLFAAAFVFHVVIRRKRFDRVFVIEPVVRRVVFALSKLLPGHPQIVWTHGVNNDPFGYVNDAHIVHEVNIENFERSRVAGPRSASIALLPHFCPDQNSDLVRKEAKALLGIRTEFALLTVGRITKATKRVDYIVDEAARLPADWTLVLCGRPADEEIVQRAQDLLGDRFVHLVVPHNRMPEVYAAADIVAHGSLNEGFGLVLIEAMRSSVPVLTHDREIFRWIAGSAGIQVDMNRAGAIADEIARMDYPDRQLAGLGRLARTEYVARFSWEALGGSYGDLLRGRLPDGVPFEAATHPAYSTWSLLQSRRRRSAKRPDASKASKRY